MSIDLTYKLPEKGLDEQNTEGKFVLAKNEEIKWMDECTMDGQKAVVVMTTDKAYILSKLSMLLEALAFAVTVVVLLGVYVYQVQKGSSQMLLELTLGLIVANISLVKAKDQAAKNICLRPVLLSFTPSDILEVKSTGRGRKQVLNIRMQDDVSHDIVVPSKISENILEYCRTDSAASPENPAVEP